MARPRLVFYALATIALVDLALCGKFDGNSGCSETLADDWTGEAYSLSGNYTVNNTADAASLANCTLLPGSLIMAPSFTGELVLEKLQSITGDL